MRPRTLLLLGVVLFAAAMGILSAGPYWEMSKTLDGMGMFDEVPAAGAADVDARLSALGPDARTQLATHIKFDVPFFLLHALGLGLIVLAAIRYVNAPRWALWVLLAPFIGAVIGDVFEDWQLHTIATSEATTERAAELLGLATRVKLGFLVGIAGSLGGAILLALTEFLRSKLSPE